MKRLVFLFVLTILCLNTRAQQKKLDSLNKMIAVAKDDTTKAMLLNEVLKIYLNYKPDSSIILGQQMLNISRASKFKKGEALALARIGNTYTATGDYPKALSYALASLKIWEELDDKKGIVQSLGNISNIYLSEGDYKQAMSYNRQCTAQAKIIGYTRGIMINALNLGDIYDRLSMPDSALKYTRYGLILARQAKDSDNIADAFNNLGNTYSELNRLDTALHYYRLAMPLWKAVDDEDGMCETTLGMAKIFKERGMRDSSLYYARQSITAGIHGGFTIRILDGSQFLTGYFKQQGQLDSAFHYQEVSIAAKDSIYSQEKLKEFQNLAFAESQRQQDIKDKDAAYTAAIRYYMLVAVILFLLVLAFVFWRNNRRNVKARHLLQLQKEQIQTTLADLKTTQSQLVQSAKMASLGELTAGIAHEIQNPLNFVNNFSEVNREMIEELEQELHTGNLEEALAITADLKANEEKINHHGKRADFIVKGMLQHSRTSTGERQLTDINILADEFLKLSYHGLRAKDKSFNAELVTNFAEDLPKVNIVQQDIGRVLLNLINNAFYAVNQKQKTAGDDYKPTVTVSTFASSTGGWGVTVRDNGTGIPDNIKDKIMQPFFTTKPTGEGTGLGLSLSYDIIVKGHGGSIEVDSKADEYTEFTIMI